MTKPKSKKKAKITEQPTTPANDIGGFASLDCVLLIFFRIRPGLRLSPRLFANDRFLTRSLNIYSSPEILAFIRHVLRDSPKLKQHTFRLQGFPLSLQLVAFHAIPQILSYIPAPIDQKTIMDLEDDYLPQHPSISSRDIRRVEFDPDHVVTPIIPIESQTQLGWGVWPNDPKVDSVIYMEQLIADHHSFNKEVWPGGVTSEPLIVKPKQRVKKKVSASIKQSLKPRQVKKKHPSIRKQRRISSYFTHATKTTFTNEQLTEIVIKLQSNMKNLKQLIKRIKKKSHGRQTPFHERLSRRKKTATPQQTDQPGPELHDAPIDQDDHTMETDDLPECQYPIISQYAAQLHRLAT
ncbi:unnamed protein product [Brassica rapa]|uniref:DUF1985 domain-containing protein n=1 Tax=Brassica campestris TaxID=3711 RepID=A0A8D9LT46_BRACM|nr:unnamed protein product [Brassica rapa]